uniref:MRP-like transporter n=1 Tax=Ganoderma boninense TaxID=34458 RepID=A0A5K1K0I5_9APHY|nr:MRP-like transporter [Ganoderma boninense]
MGGSSKRLFVHAHDSDGPPAAIQSPTDPSTFLTGPDEIKAQTVNYFTELFRRTSRAPSAKPWMDTPSVRAIRARVADHPFSWPQPLTLQDLRFLLRKGNPRPAPGPDLWEKWCVRSLSDYSLSLVLDLVNYEITDSHIPECVKPAALSTIFKRGPRTDLANYRGISCSNLLKNLPFAWLNHLLSRYLTAQQILPQTQIATQPGVQARDLTSFLSQVEAYAHRRKQPLYLLRRDQRKGFDRLEPEGFYDAVRAYGLPPSLIDLDRSAQSDVPYKVKTVHGFTPSFTVSGVTQQGGPFSPLKSTLTTSMANHWLHDILAPEQRLVFQTHHGSRGLPHTPDDRLCLRTQFVEAMDDSILLAPSLDASRTAGLHLERFQAAYGWETSWPKSLLAVLHAGPVPASLLMPSVNLQDPDSPQSVLHSVPVTDTHCEFLRVQTNDPEAQYLRIRALISDFTFPSLHTRLSFTAVRRILIQCLVSRIRPYLSYQPVTRAHANDLDRLLATRIHEYFRFPFRFHSALLFLPLSQLGFDFPSISHLNDVAAVAGLVRDLNHHVPTFQTMARITLADWTCLLNHCRSPLEGATTRFFVRSSHILPTSWIIALDVLRHFRISICCSDQSYLFVGDVALRHLVHILPSSPDSPSSLTITNFERAHVTHLSQIATWSSPSLSPSRLHPSPHISGTLQPFSARRDWPAVSQWLRTLTLPMLVNSAAGLVEGVGSSSGQLATRGFAGSGFGSLGGLSATHQLEYGRSGGEFTTRVMSDNRWQLALPPMIRRDMAEAAILAATRLSPHPGHLQPRMLASDASAVASPHHHVTFAAATPHLAVVLAISPSEASTSSLHGEVFGLIVAALLHLHQPVVDSPNCPPLYTDHLNSVRFLETYSTSSASTPTSPPLNPALPLYLWLLDIFRRTPNPPVPTYTQAHTSDNTPSALANRLVDHLASSSHASHPPCLSLPLPTFSFPTFVMHVPSHGYVFPSSIPSVLGDLVTHARLSDASARPNTVLFRSLYDTHPAPSHPYTRASSAYSALVQLYVRSSQLDDAFTRYRRFGDVSPACHFGCNILETPHHLFVECPHFTAVRDEAKGAVVRDTSLLLEAAKTPLPSEVFLHIARSLFSDNAHVWPQTLSHYFLGTVPPLPAVAVTQGAELSTQRLLSRIAALWHSASIRLVARIWGSYRRTLSPFPARLTPPLSLPPHLAHLM